MKTILLFIVGLFLLTGCKNHSSTPDSPSPAGKKAKKHSAKKRSTKSSSSSGTVTEKNSFSDLEGEILFHVNKYRRSKGLSKLQMNPVITTEAEKHSSNMASKRSGFSHAGFSSRVKRISNQLGSVSGSAENVAFGYTSAKDVVNGWLHSPGHKKNIEGSFKLTGIGVAKDRTGTLFFTQLFVTR
jgi:uncharacterized protein YkwD